MKHGHRGPIYIEISHFVEADYFCVCTGVLLIVDQAAQMLPLPASGWWPSEEQRART